MSPEPEKVPVEVEGRKLTLTNLGKVLYPETGFTKAQMIDYYLRIAPVLLPHLAGRPLTLKRYPDGVDGEYFYAKHAPGHRPSWVPTARVPSPGSRSRGATVLYLVGGDLPTLIWTANLAGLELHTPMWRLPYASQPDLLVFDLDPGPPATIVECCAVAQLLRPLLADRGIEPLAKTSGGKGLQLIAAIAGLTSEEASGLARTWPSAWNARSRTWPCPGHDQDAAPGEGAHRLEPEQRRQDHRHAVLAAGHGPAHRVHPGQLGRGERLHPARRSDVHQRRRARAGGAARGPARPAGRGTGPRKGTNMTKP